MTRGGKKHRLVIMVGDKEVHNICSERRQVEPDTLESSPEIVPVSVGRNIMIIPAGKRMVQTLISDVAKKMKMSSNIAKRKREEETPQVHCEDDRNEELYSNSSNYVIWNNSMEMGKRPLLAWFRIARYCMVRIQSVIWVTFLE